MGPVTHGDNASSSFSVMGSRIGAGFFRRKARTLAVLKEEQTSTHTVESFRGIQGIYILPSFMSKGQLKYMSDYASTSTRSTRVLVGGGKSVFHIRNQTANLCKLRIYEIWTKKTPPVEKLSTPQLAWYDHNTEQALADIVFGTPPVTVNFAHKADETPFAARDFNHYYRVHRVHTVHLEAGQQHNHTIRHNVYRALPREAWEDLPDPLATVGGWTRHFMLVWYGGLTHDTTVGSVENPFSTVNGVRVNQGNVTLSSIRLDVSVRHSFQYMLDQSTLSRITATGNFDLEVLDEDFMGETGDADRDALHA